MTQHQKSRACPDSSSSSSIPNPLYCIQSFACKSFYKTRVRSMTELRDIQLLVKIQKHVSLAGHPNVVRLIQSYEDKHMVHIVTEVGTHCHGHPHCNRWLGPDHTGSQSWPDSVSLTQSECTH